MAESQEKVVKTNAEKEVAEGGKRLADEEGDTLVRLALEGQRGRQEALGWMWGCRSRKV